MKRFRKVYLEISNICNLKCSFCPGTKRKKHAMDEADFSVLLEKLRPWTNFLYFHLMGEPLLHPELPRFLELAKEYGVEIVPMHVSFDNETLDDGTFPVERIVEYYQTTGKLPKTSGSMPEDFETAYNGVLEAVNNGTLSEERIDESLRRIYRVKYKDKVEE